VAAVYGSLDVFTDAQLESVLSESCSIVDCVYSVSCSCFLLSSSELYIGSMSYSFCSSCKSDCQLFGRGDERNRRPGEALRDLGLELHICNYAPPSLVFRTASAARRCYLLKKLECFASLAQQLSTAASCFNLCRVLLIRILNLSMNPRPAAPTQAPRPRYSVNEGLHESLDERAAWQWCLCCCTIPRHD